MSNLQTWAGFGFQLPEALHTVVLIVAELLMSHMKSTTDPSIVLYIVRKDQIIWGWGRGTTGNYSVTCKQSEIIKLVHDDAWWSTVTYTLHFSRIWFPFSIPHTCCGIVSHQFQARTNWGNSGDLTEYHVESPSPGALPDVNTPIYHQESIGDW